MYRELTGEQILAIQEKEKQNIKEGLEWLEKTLPGLGYSQVTFDDLGLTSEENKKLIWLRQSGELQGSKNVKCFVSNREDGCTVKVVAVPRKDGCFSIDILSPFFYEGHGGNHDATKSEIEHILQGALEGPEYPKK